MRFLGVDTGRSIGWCLLEDARPRARYIDSGVARYVSVLRDLVAFDEGDGLLIHNKIGGSEIDFIAVEITEGYAHGPRAGAKVAELIEARGVAEHLIGAWLHARGDQRHCLASAPEWRYLLTSESSPSDAIISAVVPAMIDGWPKKSTAHERDAAGVALVAITAARSKLIRADGRLKTSSSPMRTK